MSAIETQTRYYSTRQVADLLGVCTKSVRRLVDRGDLPQPVRFGGAVRFPSDEFNAYLERKKMERAS